VIISVEAPPLERKLIAILAADVEGYSRLMHEDEERTLATLSAHRRIIDDLIAAGRGDISGTAGDSVLAEFGSVVDAVRCAVGIQQALAKANRALPPEAAMMLRIGINVGDVMVKDGSIFGDGVNVAARLEALAEPGGICVTRGVRDHVRDRLEYSFEDLGEHSVKNIARPVRAFRLSFDPDGTTELSPGGPPTSPAATSLGGGQSGPREANATELAFWKSVQASDDPAEYGAYLARFPNGTFTALAHARLAGAPPPGEVSTEDRSVELAFWDSVKGSDSKAMFEAYLQKFPEGEFRPLAEIRIAELARSDAN
jgi:adenylate cyclase